MIVDAAWLKAKVTLGLALIWHVITAPFRSGRGPGPWLARLRAEHIAGKPEGLWDYVDDTSRCIACGLCDAVAAQQDKGGNVSGVILAATRSPGDAPLAADDVEHLERLAVAIAAICPTQVSVAGVARLLRANAAMLGK